MHKLSIFRVGILAQLTFLAERKQHGVKFKSTFKFTRDTQKTEVVKVVHNNYLLIKTGFITCETRFTK